jgi:GNAT superfamily N-acetyltransferase
MPLLVTTRPALEDDAAFALAVRERTMRRYVEIAWGAWDSAQAKKQIDEDIYQRRLRVVEVERQAVGIIRVDEQANHFHVDQMFLLPDYQNQGIGSGLIREVQAAAKQHGLPVSLWVLRVNPARRMYERLGFRVVEETNASVRLQSEA